jgi:hypothetical protein
MNHSNLGGYFLVGGEGGSSAVASGHCFVCGASTPRPAATDSSSAISTSSYSASVVLPASKRTVSQRVSEILVAKDGGSDSSAGSVVPLVDSDVICGKCYSLVSKVDSLELVLQGTKAQLRQLHNNWTRLKEGND